MLFLINSPVLILTPHFFIAHQLPFIRTQYIWIFLSLVCLYTFVVFSFCYFSHSSIPLCFVQQNAQVRYMQGSPKRPKSHDDRANSDTRSVRSGASATKENMEEHQLKRVKRDWEKLNVVLIPLTLRIY